MSLKGFDEKTEFTRGLTRTSAVRRPKGGGPNPLPPVFGGVTSSKPSVASRRGSRIRPFISLVQSRRCGIWQKRPNREPMRKLGTNRGGFRKRTPGVVPRGQVQTNAPTDDAKGSSDQGMALVAIRAGRQGSRARPTGMRERSSERGDAQDRRKSQVAGMRTATECGILVAQKAPKPPDTHFVLGF